MDLTFAVFFRILKSYVDGSAMKEEHVTSDSDLLNYLFDPLIKSKNINNKNGDLLYLDKSRTSLVLTNKQNLPSAITDEYHFLKTNAEIRTKYISLLKKCISSTQIVFIMDLLNVKNSDGYDAIYDCFIDSLLIDNIKKQKRSILIWENGCNSISLVSGDILKHCFKRNTKEEIIVIPVNTNYDVHVSTKIESVSPLVSSQTLHGKWILRCKNAGFTEEDIENKIKGFLNEQCSSKALNKEYPIGTVVPYDTEKGMTYLLAVSKFDGNNVAHATKEDIRQSIESLIRFYDRNGQGQSLFIPLIGTGRSRTDLSYIESFNLIKNTLLDNKMYIHGCVNIIALTEAYEIIKSEEDNAI